MRRRNLELSPVRSSIHTNPSRKRRFSNGALGFAFHCGRKKITTVVMFLSTKQLKIHNAGMLVKKCELNPSTPTEMRKIHGTKYSGRKIPNEILRYDRNFYKYRAEISYTKRLRSWSLGYTTYREGNSETKCNSVIAHMPMSYF